MKLALYVFRIICALIALGVLTMLYNIQYLFQKKKGSPFSSNPIATEKQIIYFLVQYGTEKKIHKEAFLSYLQSNYVENLCEAFTKQTEKILTNNGNINTLLKKANKKYAKVYDKNHTPVK